MRLALLILPLLLLFSSPAHSTPVVEYQVRFETTALQIKIDCPANGQDSVTFEIGDWAGVSDFFRSIQKPVAKTTNGSPLEVVSRDSTHWVVRNSGKPFTLSYQVVSPKTTFTGSSREDIFRPTLLPDLAYVWGVAAFLIPSEDSLSQLGCRLSLDRGNYTMAAVSLDTTEIFSTSAKLRDCLLIAGDYRPVHRKIGSVDVDFYMHGACAFSDSQFVSAVDKILSAQISYFGEYPLERQMVVLLEGTVNSSGGSVTSGIIAVYPDPTDSLKGPDSKTLRLISHEHYHVWAEKLRLAEDQPEGYYKWFSEGFADYYSELTLYRAGLTDAGGFVDGLNRLIRLYYGNPYAKTATADTLAIKFWSDNNYNHLPYHKGALIGLLMDIGIAGQSGGQKNLDSYLRELLRVQNEDTSGLNNRDLLSTLNSVSGGQWDQFYQQYMLGADELPLEKNLTETGIAIKRTDMRIYSLGFTTNSGRMGKNEVVKSILPRSEAEASGIQVGDTLIGYSYHSEDTTQDATIRVRRNGESLSFQYLPVQKMTVPQIIAGEPTLAAIRRLLAENPEKTALRSK
jgi:predicted metalloprotease with PDZ domain